MRTYHPADIVELLQKIENLIRQGVIYETKGDRVKVKSGQNITTWLPWLTHRSGKNRTWWRPSIGEQVLILSPSGNLNLGVVLPSIYSDEFPAPSNTDSGLFIEFADKATLEYDNKMTFKLPDGAVFMYDPNTSALSITGINTALIDANNNITAKAGSFIKLETPTVVCSNHITFQTFSATGGAALGGNTGNIKGDINHSDGKLSSNDVVVHTHTHSGVMSGSNSTGGPK